MAKGKKGMAFARGLSSFTRRVETRAVAVVDGVTFGVYANLTADPRSVPGGTPRRTGYAASNWFISVLVVGDERNPAGEGPFEPLEVASFMGDVAGAPLGVKRFVYNHTAYILFLENGSSTQAPAGMVQVVIARVRNGASSDV